jgi:transposase-like protein
MQMNPNPPAKSGWRSRFSTEQKLALLQQWQSGTPMAELCRAHSLTANALSCWKKRLDLITK